LTGLLVNLDLHLFKEANKIAGTFPNIDGKNNSKYELEDIVEKECKYVVAHF